MTPGARSATGAATTWTHIIDGRRWAAGVRYLWRTGARSGQATDLADAARDALAFLPDGYDLRELRIAEARPDYFTSVPRLTGWAWRPWTGPDGRVRWYLCADPELPCDPVPGATR